MAKIAGSELEMSGEGARPLVNGFRLRYLVGALIFGFGLIAGYCIALGAVASAGCAAFCGGG